MVEGSVVGSSIIISVVDITGSSVVDVVVVVVVVDVVVTIS